MVLLDYNFFDKNPQTLTFSSPAKCLQAHGVSYAMFTITIRLCPFDCLSKVIKVTMT